MRRNYTNMCCMTLWMERRDLDESIWMTMWKTNMPLQRISPFIWAKFQCPSCSPNHTRMRREKLGKRKKIKRVGGERLFRSFAIFVLMFHPTLYQFMGSDTTTITTNLGKPAAPALPSRPSPSGSSNKLRRSSPSSSPPNSQAYPYQPYQNQRSRSPSHFNNTSKAVPPTTRGSSNPLNPKPPAFPVPNQESQVATTPIKPEVQGVFDILTHGWYRWVPPSWRTL